MNENLLNHEEKCVETCNEIFANLASFENRTNA